MIRSLFIGASGMTAQKTNLDVISNNIANTSTYGFKLGRAEFQDLMYQAVQAPGAPTAVGYPSPTGIQIGLGVMPSSAGKVFKQGDFINSNNELDIAIEGKGFFQIALTDGSIAYTRAGNFKLDSTGRIVNDQGLVLQPEMTVPTDTVSISIASDGTVSVLQNTQTTESQIGQIELGSFANPAGLKAIGKNLFTETDASGAVNLSTPGLQGFGTLSQGFLETSNVNVIDEMVNMIVSQRAYEFNSKSVQTTDEMLQTANSLKR
ncbi:flagellar basal-body rod protein FlgG [Candidatus Magnetominusculus xianensis]|uniref:Flagellar basal-body rod protein FlgG n=1 Tax=Candidatus Magnetominusculus xianensis TaxID=1748249 RepID=A0ABR5SG83_9BACT|nr:flagellar basal-body rod protein FlgG [Candidatus Magnetominusculus xianensis]KWT85391.1 flagellar basal body rod protein FlgG [Candidatus Magnetominusculus xianensis]MBF0405130.1 flagellar basal-body rod protein FlgG [Nitrospirota bacterium]